MPMTRSRSLVSLTAGMRLLRAGAIPVALALGLLLAGCTGGASDLDFPPYPPTDPFLEQQEQMQRRVEANRELRARRRHRATAASRLHHLREWSRLQRRQEIGLMIRRQEEMRRRHPDDRADPRRLREWRRIVR